MAVIDMKEKNRGSKEMNQLTVVSEGIPALGWVTLVSFVNSLTFREYATDLERFLNIGQSSWTLRRRVQG